MGEMAFRPQFVYPHVEGTRDEEFVYFFDRTNVPNLAQPILPGKTAPNIPLPLDPDAEFHLRGIAIYDPSGLAGFQLRDQWGNYLTDSFISVDLAMQASGTDAPPLEPEIVCQPGAVLQLDLVNTLP